MRALTLDESELVHATLNALHDFNDQQAAHALSRVLRLYAKLEESDANEIAEHVLLKNRRRDIIWQRYIERILPR